MNTGTLALLIPIIAIIMGCGIPLLAIFTDYRKRKEMFALFHQERMAAIEKGIELPPLPEEFLKSFFSDEDKKNHKPRSPHRRLLAGLVWMFLGLACFVTSYMVDGSDIVNDPDIVKLTKLGFFPMGIGLAYLIYYFVIGKKEAGEIEAERKAKAAETNRPLTT